MKRPVFVMQSVSNFGTSNPIVARMGLQSVELLKWVDLHKNEFDHASKLIFDNHRRLIRCYECVERLKQNDRETLENTKTIFNASAISLPYVKDLREDAENFLSAAKQFLRDMVAPMNILFRSNLKEDPTIFWDTRGGVSKAAQWSSEAFGPQHSLTGMLKSDSAWIADLIKRRNAMEHPGGKSGTLVIENYRLSGPSIAAPSWRRDVAGAIGPTTRIIPDLEAALQALLEFGEEIVVQAVLSRPVNEHVTVYEIPETEREMQNPQRFKPGLDNFLLEKLNQAELQSKAPERDVMPHAGMQ